MTQCEPFLHPSLVEVELTRLSCYSLRRGKCLQQLDEKEGILFADIGASRSTSRFRL
jgi:hypothetical protein